MRFDDHLPIWRYAAAILITATITIIMVFVEPNLESANIALFYLLGVLIMAISAGLGPGIMASLFSFLAFNFFFVPPLYTFYVKDPQHVLHLVTYLVVAVIASGLAGRARSEAASAARQATETVTLYNLSQAISAQVDLDQILPTIAETTCRLLQVPSCVILLYDQAGLPYEHTVVGQADPRLHSLNAFMRDGSTVLGVLRVAERMPGAGLGQHEQRLLDTLAAQARLAVDRARLVKQEAHIAALAESDQLKSALISSVSHDLRTPLAVIKGAVSTLLADDIAWDVATQRALARTIDDEADRLNRIVGNLLFISQIETGALPIERDRQDITEVIGSVLQRMAGQLAGHPVTVEAAPNLPFVAFNATLIDQVLTNLLENAIKYTPLQAPITIGVCYDAGAAEIAVAIRDRGPGIALDQLTRIFDKFYRDPDTEHVAAGSGLGLAICKGIVAAHGGRVWAENRPSGGAAFIFTLPVT